MSDSVLGTILQSAFTSEAPVGVPAAFSGLDVDDLREAYAALAEVGHPGVSIASAAVAAAAADDVDGLLAAAARVELPTVEVPLAEPLVAGEIETTDLDHHALFDEAFEEMTIEFADEGPLVHDLVTDDVFGAVSVADIDLDFDDHDAITVDDGALHDLDTSDHHFDIDHFQSDVVVDDDSDQVDDDDDDPDEADDIF